VLADKTDPSATCDAHGLQRFGIFGGIPSLVLTNKKRLNMDHLC
jgi:hypothetical protein